MDSSRITPVLEIGVHTAELTKKGVAWYSKFKGGTRRNGFRVDHAFAHAFADATHRVVQYSRVERDAGVSDHSMVIVTRT